MTFESSPLLVPEAEVVTIQSGNAHLIAERCGSGQPLVFLHAAIADRRMWHHQVRALSATFQTIAYDRRGFGETLPVAEPHSPVDDLFSVINTLSEPGSHPILVACSNGGSIAIDAALERPNLFSALILISPSVSGSPVPIPHPAVQKLLDAISVASSHGDIDAINRFKAALFLDGAQQREGRVEGDARRLFLEMNRIALKHAHTGTTLPPPPAWDRVNHITLPVRILCGEFDIPHIQSRCEQLAKRMPDAHNSKSCQVPRIYPALSNQN